MKKNSCSLSKRLLILWLAVHAGILALLGLAALNGKKLKINANLFEVLPQTDSSRAVSKADSVLNERTSRMFYILIGTSDLEDSKRYGAELYEKISVSKECFDELYWTVDSDSYEKLQDYFFEHRTNLLSKETISLLENSEGVADYAQDAVTEFYNPFTLADVSKIEEDPFLMNRDGIKTLFEKVLNTGTSMVVTDDIMCCEYESRYYVMIRGVMSKTGSAINNKKSAVKLIYEVTEQMEKEGADIIYSGVPFHSYESSSGAQLEITVISVVSVILIFGLCLLVFKSILPVLASFVTIILSAGFALVTVLAVFNEIHVLTFVFGTTIIGMCLDYSVHFFVRWKGDKNLTDGNGIRNEMRKSLSLSLFSTEICYVLLMFAPFVLLRQIALFCFSGILSTYLTVMCIYPLIRVPDVNKKQRLNCQLDFKLSKKIREIIFYSFLVIIFLISFAFKKNIRIENNLKSFYTMTGKLLDSEIKAEKIMNFGSSGCYFIVRGNSREEVLNNEYLLCSKLDEYKNLGFLQDYNCCTNYISAPLQQKKSYESALQFKPYAFKQFKELGIDGDVDELADNFINSFSGFDCIYPDTPGLPESFVQPMKALWIGCVDGSYYTVVMPRYVSEHKELKKLADTDSNFYFMNKMSDISDSLNRLTKLMLCFLIAAVIIMFIVMLCYYSFKKAFKIIIIPLTVVASCIAVLSITNIPLGFFSVTGIVLVFGLGIDYMIYAVERPDTLTGYAIVISFISSVISFSALAFSSFMPVKMFGITVTAGLIAAIVGTFLLHDDKVTGNVD